jgi:hypothetical protein
MSEQPFATCYANILDSSAKQFRHAPCLRNAALRMVWRFSIRDFGNLSESRYL